MNIRHEWVDRARGLGIFLVIYGHNFPFLESYIYSFHVPLFFFIAGIFHPKERRSEHIVKRAKTILIPYFIWSFLLYIFWLIIGRHVGESSHIDLDPFDGLIGVFYAQGDVSFMDWGIPMWFLPSIFLTFAIFYICQFFKEIKSQLLLVGILITVGFLYPIYFEFKLPWSLDVSLVSLIFYVPGFLLKRKLLEFKPKKKTGVVTFCFFLLTFIAFFNTKVDMYRSIYGSIPLFIFNGFIGVFFVTLFCKQIKFFGFFSYLGKCTIPLLALHLRAMSIIKLGLLTIGVSVFTFSEPTKFVLVFVQIALIWPVISLANKYIPILNGKIKK
ncbi:acyltransferase family protein [Tamlana sp. 2_MG-2023]|uniref:acyltransferase family protein n=1 Tax=unclassified Tamlana TaxID=2614803 RepID=UPI0026E1CCBE|nr:MULTISPECIES: acyltransferase family protein [unclassified Tamlana]MDO6759667.1 acyltransferase family protein [Tamlana sp. 2_MG-2023]MDO6791290.1 acyltransferase family protein [Tamlana sp. 1_MG-2023]